jgi:hypothetical protein
MKRTPIRPSTKPIARYAAPKRGQPPKQSRRKRKCYRHLRRPDYKAWMLENYPCEVEGKEVTPGVRHRCAGRLEFAHVGNEGTGHPDVGNGLTLCTEAHTAAPWSWHRDGKKSFQRRFQLNATERAAEIGRAFEAWA